MLKCKCGAEILWVLMPTGKKARVDAEPTKVWVRGIFKGPWHLVDGYTPHECPSGVNQERLHAYEDDGLPRITTGGAAAPWSKAEVIRACDKMLATMKTRFTDKEKLLFMEGGLLELKTEGRVYPLPQKMDSTNTKRG